MINVPRNIHVENTNVDFNTLNYPEESINKWDTGDESESENDFHTDISDNDSSPSDFSPYLVREIEITHFELVNYCFNFCQW